MKRRAFLGGLFAGTFSLIATPALALSHRRVFGVIQRQKEPSIQGKRRWLLVACRRNGYGQRYKCPIYDDGAAVYVLQLISTEWFGRRGFDRLYGGHQTCAVLPACGVSGAIGIDGGLIHWRIVPDGDSALESWSDVPSLKLELCPC